jgi:hypothetical protein
VERAVAGVTAQAIPEVLVVEAPLLKVLLVVLLNNLLKAILVLQQMLDLLELAEETVFLGQEVEPTQVAVVVELALLELEDKAV